MHSRHLYSGRLFLIVAILVLSLAVVQVTSAQGPSPRTATAMGTGITYQGQLKNSGNAYTGNCDFQFSLFDAASSGNPIGTTQTTSSVAVAGGLFTVPIDFGPGAFNGDARWLGISLRCPAGSGSYTALTSRQPIAAAPYALYATTANTANSAITAGTATTATTAMTAWNMAGNVGTNPASNFVGTTDNMTLTLRVNNTVGWRLAPNGTGIPIVIGGYAGNTVSGTDEGATIGGGGSNIFGQNIISGTNVSWATIGGGVNNRILGSSYNSVITGGYGNTISGTRFQAGRSVIGGGYNNTVSASQATIAGGDTNSASTNYTAIGGGKNNQATGDSATVAGGNTNHAAGWQSTVGGGYTNTAAGQGGTVPGGYGNSADGAYSFAAGYRAKANHNGAFVWADNEPYDFASTADNQFDVRAIGGIYLYTSAGFITGAKLAPGSGTWASFSDRNGKANFAATDGKAILARLNAIPIQTWNYKTEDSSIRHIGPMAQDFYSAFAVGEDDTHITTVDSDGVALAAIQGLSQIVQEKDGKIAAQQKQLDDLEARVAALERAGGNAPHAAAPSSPWSWVAFGGLVVAGLAIKQKRDQR